MIPPPGAVSPPVPRPDGGPLLLQVKSEAGEVLIPFVPAICVVVDLENRSISVDLPEGQITLFCVHRGNS